MKDILKMMRFDFISAVGTSGAGSRGANVILSIFMAVMFLGVALFVSPVFAFCLIFASGALIVPLQSAKNEDLGKLYGLLPVERKNITRARFLYIFLIHLLMLCSALLLASLSVALDLNRFIAGSSDALKTLSEMYDPEVFGKMIPVFLGFAVLSCVTFAFMEMLGQIQGRQSEMKVLFILIVAVCVIVLGSTFILGQLGYPEIKLPDLPEWLALSLVFLGVLGICVLFGEITASKLSKREL